MSVKKVTVIGISHNQQKYISAALNSVWAQTYQNIQLIVVDDASIDGSKEVIRHCLTGKTDVRFIDLKENGGNCAAFNVGLKYATGDYLVDFALDDTMHPQRLQRQIEFFEMLDRDYGVIFSNAEYVDAEGKWIKNHFSNASHPSQGDVYPKLISTYFVPAPTMMVRRVVMEDLGGYDESLAYEDFDFWVRSARKYKYAYQPDILTSIRKHTTSLSTRWYRQGDPQLYSTYLVCRKAQQLNRSPTEDQALISRLKYEIRQSVLTANYSEANLFIGMLEEYQTLPLFYRLLKVVNRMKLDLRLLMSSYQLLSNKFFRPKTHFK